MSANTREQLTDQLAAMKADILDKAATSPRIFDLYRTILDLQQKCFDEERSLWEQERQRLAQYISCLEHSLMFFQVETTNKYVNPEKPYVSTDDEVGRGIVEKSGSRPAKRFPDSSSDASKPEGRLRTIDEKVSSENPKRPFVLGTGISVPKKDGDLEGINFKENIRAPPIAESLMASQSASPLHFQSPTRGIPPAGVKPSSLLAAPPITDAGHKLPASQVGMKMDSSAVSSSLVTPIYTDPEKSPREPHTSAAKLPSERAYTEVPRLEPDRDGGDAELKGPLSLKNNNREDKIFLRELDSKLLQAAKSMTAEEPDNAKKHDSKDDVGSHQSQSQPGDELEPELQLKPSMNFGSPFGAPYCGKGI